MSTTVYLGIRQIPLKVRKFLNQPGSRRRCFLMPRLKPVEMLRPEERRIIPQLLLHAVEKMLTSANDLLRWDGREHAQKLMRRRLRGVPVEEGELRHPGRCLYHPDSLERIRKHLPRSGHGAN